MKNRLLTHPARIFLMLGPLAAAGLAPDSAAIAQPVQIGARRAGILNPDASAIRTEEILCKGGPTLNFQTLGTSGSTATMQLNFTPARDERGRVVAAGGSGERLEPATCSFPDRIVHVGDPNRIRFETAAGFHASPDADAKRMQHGSARGSASAISHPDSSSIPAYLTDPRHYWSFSVYKTGQGHFYAVKHGPWAPRHTMPITGNPGRAADANLAIGRLTDVRVFPELGGVGFRFVARPNATPIIELSADAPLIGRDGRAVLRNPITMRADREDRSSTPLVAVYIGSSTAQRVRLQQGASYHYLITVPGDGAVATQYASGTFTTLAQTVVVRFQSVRVLNISSDGDGVDFTFRVNPGEPGAFSEQLFDVATAPGRYALGDRARATIRGEVERLRIVIEGAEWERGCFAGRKAPVAGPRHFDEAQPAVRECGHANVAKGEFLLSSAALLGQFANKPFVLVATLGPHGSQLVFEVTGSIEVERPR